ncbi:MSC_0622 family F1-like ATPase gamma subunit [Mycoplasma phocimorsus]|uniref:MSC_0622 family F1-like ATPase gamma subunit n=1 Tax=Mycoplasma phocimorsus TaxID=3045839 RepID=UPI0024BF99BD|nr:F0F1 ATP synthase subunit gamma [Mycoplasma phocimorsus]MDJ1646596.1 hypothetical protein [Mycoplasma phocimorsus]MDJ1648107.1 hypothetical protein [Mycoplasma phocimorsus]
MELGKIEKKYKNIQHISKKVQNDKNILTISIMKKSNIINNSVELARNSQYILEFLKEKYNIDGYLKPRKIPFFKGNSKELWIYVTEEKTKLTNPHERYEKLILKSRKKTRVDFITVGEAAFKFCKKNRFNIIKKFEGKETDKIREEVAKFITKVSEVENYKSIKFIINSNKNLHGYFTLFPFENSNINLLYRNSTKQHLENDIKKYQIIPEVNVFIKSLTRIYLFYSICSLMLESNLYNAKVSLVALNKTIKTIDEMMLKLKRKISRVRRELELEELIMLTNKTQEE